MVTQVEPGGGGGSDGGGGVHPPLAAARGERAALLTLVVAVQRDAAHAGVAHARGAAGAVAAGLARSAARFAP